MFLYIENTSKKIFNIFDIFRVNDNSACCQEDRRYSIFVLDFYLIY